MSIVSKKDDSDKSTMSIVSKKDDSDKSAMSTVLKKDDSDKSTMITVSKKDDDDDGDKSTMEKRSLLLKKRVLDINNLQREIEKLANDVCMKLYEKSCKRCRSCKRAYDEMVKILKGKNKFMEIEKLVSKRPPSCHMHECYMTMPIRNITNNFYDVACSMEIEKPEDASKELNYIFEMLECYRDLSPEKWIIVNIFTTPEEMKYRYGVTDHIPYSMMNKNSLESHVIYVHLLMAVLDKTL